MYFDVLTAIDDGTHKPTRIMYRTNLSWRSLCEVLETLIHGGFVREEAWQRSKRYYLTAKGRNALAYHVKSLEGFPHNE
jgi:predicted transcriptional regulator